LPSIIPGVLDKKSAGVLFVQRTGVVVYHCRLSRLSFRPRRLSFRPAPSNIPSNASIVAEKGG
jgi:hypothetical protein